MNFYIRKKKEILEADLDGEICLFEPSNAEYISLNKTASTIWCYLEEYVNINDLHKILISIYDIEEEICKKEIYKFLETLIKYNLIERKND